MPVSDKGQEQERRQRSGLDSDAKKKYPAMPPEADRLLDWLMAVRYLPCGQHGETEDTEEFREA